VVRRKSIPVNVGGVVIGGAAPIAVQTMTKTDTRDVKATLRQIHELKDVGCEIVRPAVPDREAAEALKEIVKEQVQAIERDLIVRGLEVTNGNVTRTAKLLKISRKSLQMKMKEFGLRGED